MEPMLNLGLCWICRQWAQAAQGMLEVPKRPARPPSEEDDDEDEDSSERMKGSRKESMSQKGRLVSYRRRLG